MKTVRKVSSPAAAFEARVQAGAGIASSWSADRLDAARPTGRRAGGVATPAEVKAEPARLDVDRTAVPKTEIVGIFPAGQKNFYFNAEALMHRDIKPEKPIHTCVNTATTFDGRPPPPCPGCAAMTIEEQHIAIRARPAETNPELLALAVEAQEKRKGEDVDAWAEQLAADSVAAGEMGFAPRSPAEPGRGGKPDYSAAKTPAELAEWWLDQSELEHALTVEKWPEAIAALARLLANRPETAEAAVEELRVLDKVRSNTIEMCIAVCEELSAEDARGSTEASADGHTHVAQACLERSVAAWDIAKRLRSLRTTDEKERGRNMKNLVAVTLTFIALVNRIQETRPQRARIHAGGQMSGDFFKNLKALPKVDYLYRCAECGEEDWYVMRMPDEWKHEVDHAMRRCGGLLVLVREEDREARKAAAAANSKRGTS